MQNNHWNIIGDPLPNKSPIEFKDNPNNYIIHHPMEICDLRSGSGGRRIPICAAELQICSEMRLCRAVESSGKRIDSCCLFSRHQCSMRRLTVRSTLRALSGNSPMADSPDNISASARCLTASETSATCIAHQSQNNQSSGSVPLINIHANYTGHLTSCSHKVGMLCWLKWSSWLVM